MTKEDTKIFTDVNMQWVNIQIPFGVKMDVIVELRFSRPTRDCIALKGKK